MSAPRAFFNRPTKEPYTMRSLLLFFLGVPIPLIILIALLF